MFGRLVRNGAPAIPQRLAGGTQLQARNAVSLKTVKERMRSVESIKKITKAMKMVAAAKMRGDMRRMELGMPFVKPVQNLFERLPVEDKSGQITLLAITGDKGLCGGVNSAVNKIARLSIVEEEQKGNAVKVQIMGGKGEAGLKRLYGDRFTTSFTDLAKMPWNFTTASVIADKVSAADPKRLQVIHNEFKSMVAYDTEPHHAFTKAEVKAIDKAEWSKAMDVYEFEPSIFEVWDDLHEWYLACVVYEGYLNNLVCEQAQRMSAMENASKNAGEVLEKVTIQYNRARQAKITTELCEIISGASAV